MVAWMKEYSPTKIGVSPGHMAGVIVLSLFPGAGHLILRRRKAGLTWMAITFFGYLCYVMPGLFLHFMSLIHAVSSAQNAMICSRCRRPLEQGDNQCRWCRLEPANASPEVNPVSPTLTSA